MHETKICSSGDKTMSFDPMSLCPLGLQNILREAEHNSLMYSVLLVQVFADIIKEAIEDHLKSVKF